MVNGMWQKEGHGVVEGAQLNFGTCGFWAMCCGRARVVYSGTTLVNVLWKGCGTGCGLLFGGCAVEERWMWCGSASVG